MSQSIAGFSVRRGYSLIELVVALSVSTLLLGALGSAVVIAATALPGQGGGATGSVLDAARGLDTLAGELEQAVYAPEMAATAVGVVLPDSDGDGAPEVVRHAWAGTGGDPLTRVEDGGDAEDVLDEVDGLTLGYESVSRVETYPGAIVTTSGVLDAFPAVVGRSNTITLDKNKAFAQRLTPTLPVGVATWRATSVELYMRTDGLVPLLEAGTITMQIRGTKGTTPASTVLANATQNESALKTTYAWVPFTWASPPTLDAGASYFVVFGNTSSDSSAGRLTSEKDAGIGLYEGSIGGTFWSGDASDPSWSERGGEEILFRLYGEYETQNPDIGITRRFVTRFTMDLTVGGDATTTLSSDVRALNSPEVLSNYWDADFSSDPTALDLNADGTSDWDTGGSAFDPATLASGVWKASGSRQLIAQPTTDLTRPTYVDLRWRSPTSGQPGMYFFIAADQGKGEQCVLVLWLRCASATSQALTLSYITDGGGMAPLASVTPQTTGLIDTRLVIDPATNSVVLEVEGSEVGTYLYDTRPYAASDHKTRIVPTGSGNEVDRMRVRMGAP